MIMIHVGKKTSIRRDCDISNRSKFSLILFVGKKTSIRRDCDLIMASLSMQMVVWVGKKTSIRRDCDYFLFSLSLSSILQERRPQLEGIATRHKNVPVAAFNCRKEDLNQKGLRHLGAGTLLLSCLVGKKTSIRRDCDGVYWWLVREWEQVGKKTSIRRDCDVNSKSLKYVSPKQERRPQLEGIATSNGKRCLALAVQQERRPQLEGIATFEWITRQTLALKRRKEDLNQKGLRQ